MYCCQSCQALPGLIKWSAALCIVTAWWVLAAVATSCRALMPKSGLSWWMGSLSPSNYRWIFRCIHYLHWPGLRVCGCTCKHACGWVWGLLLHWLNCRGSAGMCRGGVQGFLFQLCCRLSAIFMSSLGISVLCRLRPPLPPKLPSSLHQTTVSEHLDLSTPTTIIQSFYMWHIHWNPHLSHVPQVACNWWELFGLKLQVLVKDPVS